MNYFVNLFRTGLVMSIERVWRQKNTFISVNRYSINNPVCIFVNKHMALFVQ
jgi:hypothetical protein